jgi:aryl-alcohol dehydrogenase-like predicted oxidoreductase
MEYRELGRGSGLRVSAIGFGCWETGGEYGAYDQGEVILAVHRALDLGVTLFDTARGYGFGRSEELLAQALGSRRKDVVVVTKVGLERGPNGGYRRDSSRATLLSGLENSLRALHTDYVDLLLIHWPDRTRPWAEAMETLQEIQRSGKARHIGVSNFQAADLRACADLAPLVANQVGFNLFDRRWEREVFATAGELGIGIMAYGPLAHGLLTGHLVAGDPFQETDWRARGDLFGQPLLAPDNLTANLAVVEKLRALAEQLGMSVAQLAIAWVLHDPMVAVALTGCRTPAEIEENAGAAERSLDGSTLATIDQAMVGARGQVGEVMA